AAGDSVAAAAEGFRLICEVVADFVDYDGTTLNIRQLQPRYHEMFFRISVLVHHQRRQVATVPLAFRSFVSAALIRIVVTAGRKSCDHFPVLFLRTTVAVFVQVETVLAGREPLEVGRHAEATLAVFERNRAERLADALFIDAVDRGACRRNRQTDHAQQRGAYRYVHAFLRHVGRAKRYKKKAALSGSGRVASRLLAHLFGLTADLVVPQIVMLLGPLAAGASTDHSFQRALHAPRAEIDVAKHQRHPRGRRDAMYEIRRLHGLARLAEQRKVEHDAADADGAAEQHQPQPERQILLARVNASRVRVFPFLAQIPARATQPLPVGRLGQCVADPDDDFKNDADDEERTEIIVQRDRDVRISAEAGIAHRGYQHGASEEQAQAGDPQDDEQHRGVPVQHAFAHAPALHGPARRRMLQFDLSAHDRQQ